MAVEVFIGGASDKYAEFHTETYGFPGGQTFPGLTQSAAVTLSAATDITVTIGQILPRLTQSAVVAWATAGGWVLPRIGQSMQVGTVRAVIVQVLPRVGQTVAVAATVDAAAALTLPTVIQSGLVNIFEDLPITVTIGQTLPAIFQAAAVTGPVSGWILPSLTQSMNVGTVQAVIDQTLPTIVQNGSTVLTVNVGAVQILPPVSQSASIGISENLPITVVITQTFPALTQAVAATGPVGGWVLPPITQSMTVGPVIYDMTSGGDGHIGVESGELVGTGVEGG